MATPGDVLRQAHDEGVFIADVDHQRRDVGFPQDAEGVQAPLAADEQVFGMAIVARAFGDGDGFLQADLFDVLDDLLEDFHVALAGIEDFNPGNGIRVTVSGVPVSMGASA